MGKQTVTMTIDSDIIEEVRQLNINISGEINEYLKTLVARHNEDIEGINIKIERIELDKALKKLNHWQVQTKTIQSRIDKWEMTQKEKEKDKLEREKKAIESANRCDNCKEVKGNNIKMHKFGKLSICNSCYISSSKDVIIKWMNQK